jgi:hypothetical protein
MWEVRYHEDAEKELKELPTRERVALANAVQKLEAFGPQLPSPHQSKVMGSTLRELRPRGGNSPWRAFYQRIGDVFFIGAIGPEAQVDKRKFNRAVEEAQRRLEET